MLKSNFRSRKAQRGIEGLPWEPVILSAAPRPAQYSFDKLLRLI